MMPHKIKKSENTGGFTLVEIIVVLVIIAVLAAILIPSLTGYIDKANKTACLETRAMLSHQILAARALHPELSKEDILGGAASDLVDPDEYKCPSGGTYSYKDGVLTCSIHGDEGGSSETYFKSKDYYDITDSIYQTLPLMFEDLFGAYENLVINISSLGDFTDQIKLKSEGNQSYMLISELLEAYGSGVVTNSDLPSGLKVFLVNKSSTVTSAADAEVSCILYKSGSRWIVTYPDGSIYSLANSFGSGSGNQDKFVRDEAYLTEYISQNPGTGDVVVVR